MFNYVLGQIICPVCKEEMELKFQEVKKYVDENKHSSITDVAEACEVEPVQVQQWIREERLCFAEDSPIKLPCESCGTMIGSGKYCDKCKRELQTGFGDMLKSREHTVERQKDPRQAARMRFLDKI